MQKEFNSHGTYNKLNILFRGKNKYVKSQDVKLHNNNKGRLELKMTNDEVKELFICLSYLFNI